MTAVFPIEASWPLIHDLKHINYLADYGDGIVQGANFNLAYTRANGEGGVTSYKGQNRFTLRFQALDYNAAKTIWAFYKARTGNLEPFYLYNIPEERASIDLTGADTTGRYLVRFEQPQLTLEKFTASLFNAGISMIECRS